MPPASRVGSVVNEWRLEALLASNRIAATYAARRDDERATLQLLGPQAAEQRPTRERFLASSDVAKEIEHAAIVRVRESGTTRQGDVFLLMEPLVGESVQSRFAAAPSTFTVARVLPLFVRLLDVLEACHERSVLHRSLSLASVVVAEDDAIKVLDFGLAALAELGRDGGDPGDPTGAGACAYIAPEQAMGLAAQVDARADLFAVGAMMHHVLTGHRVHPGRTELEVLVMAATRPVPSVALVAPRLAPCVAAVVDRALQWDRRRRYPSAAAMRVAIAAALRDQRPN